MKLQDICYCIQRRRICYVRPTAWLKSCGIITEFSLRTGKAARHRISKNGMSRAREGEPNVSGSGTKGTVQIHPPWFTWSLANPEKVLSRVVRSRFSCRAEVESCSRRRRREKEHVNTLNSTNSSRLSVPTEETLHSHFVLWVLRLLTIRFACDVLISARWRQLTTVIFLPFVKYCLVCFCAFILISLRNFFLVWFWADLLLLQTTERTTYALKLGWIFLSMFSQRICEAPLCVYCIGI